MKKSIAVLICFSLFFTMLISSAFAQDPDPEMEALQKMSFTELVDYMNADPPDEESEETIGFAYLLQTRMNEVSAEIFNGYKYRRFVYKNHLLRI